LITKAYQLAGNEDLMTLRVDHSIYMSSLSRDVLHKFDHYTTTRRIIMDGKDIISILMAIQLQGASSVYNSCNLCAFNNAEFTGQQPL
jgi:hypothetical protein